jgi:RNA polymerase sigma-70 factor (ECF subfamily)
LVILGYSKSAGVDATMGPSPLMGRNIGLVMARRAVDHVDNAHAVEDRELTLSFQNGEKGAYQAIYDRYEARVRGVCRRMLIDRDDAAEAAQETFLRIYTGLGSFNGTYQLGAWIARIATNVCLDSLRAKNRRPNGTAPLEVLEFETSVQTGESDPEHLVIRNAEGRRVRKVLASLPAMHRAAIVLRDFEGLTYEEIALALEVSDSQVKALLHRARKRFKRSWTASLAALLPLGPLRRLRDLHGTREQATQAAAQVSASGAQVSSACVTFLQQCGPVFTERIGQVAASLMVGTAVAATALSPAPAVVAEPRSEEVVVAAARIEARPTQEPGNTSGTPDRSVAANDGTPSEAVPPPSEETPTEPGPTPGTEPEPDPSPSPEPEPSSSSPTPSSAPQGQPQPVSSTTTAAIGFDRGQPIPGHAPTYQEARVDCDGHVVEQRLRGTVYDGGRALSGELRLWVGANLSIELTVYKDGMAIVYFGGGSPARDVRSGDTLELAYSGHYGTGNPDAGALGLPDSGRFTANLTLDCATSSVVSESLTFNTQ